jgi:hypothetical protein
MRIAELIQRWDNAQPARPGEIDVGVSLPLYDTARVTALRQLYPQRTESELIAELLHAALDELELAMPIVPGKRVIAEDDRGAPIYEDLGMTPRFYTLSHEILRRLVDVSPAK